MKKIEAYIRHEAFEPIQHQVNANIEKVLKQSAA